MIKNTKKNNAFGSIAAETPTVALSTISRRVSSTPLTSCPRLVADFHRLVIFLSAVLAQAGGRQVFLFLK